MNLKIFNTAYNGLLKIIKIIVVVQACILVTVVFSNVISRYFLHAALAWSEETARFLFIWLTFLGAILANASDEHMRLDMVIKFAPKKVGQILNVIADSIIIVILCILLKGGIIIVTRSLDWMTPALDIPYGLVYSVVPLSCVILILQSIIRLIKDIKTLFLSNNKKVLSELSQ